MVGTGHVTYRLGLAWRNVRPPNRILQGVKQVRDHEKVANTIIGSHTEGGRGPS